MFVSLCSSHHEPYWQGRNLESLLQAFRLHLGHGWCTRLWVTMKSCKETSSESCFWWMFIDEWVYKEPCSLVSYDRKNEASLFLCTLHLHGVVNSEKGGCCQIIAYWSFAGKALSANKCIASSHRKPPCFGTSYSDVASFVCMLYLFQTSACSPF